MFNTYCVENTLVAVCAIFIIAEKTVEWVGRAVEWWGDRYHPIEAEAINQEVDNQAIAELEPEREKPRRVERLVVRVPLFKIPYMSNLTVRGNVDAWSYR